MAKHEKTELDLARDELLSHIHRCGVLKATTEQQDVWLEDTMQYMAERYTDLSAEQLEELRQIGQRFCKPVIAHGREESPGNSSEGSEQGEMAGAA